MEYWKDGESYGKEGQGEARVSFRIRFRPAPAFPQRDDHSVCKKGF